MLRLRLFRRDEPSVQIDSHVLGEGEVSIGRDDNASWTVPDPERTISRRHLTVTSHGGLVTVLDTSSNGVFLGEPRRRIEPNRAIPIGPGDAIQFGGFLLMLEDTGADVAVAERTPSLPFGPATGIDAPQRRAEPQPFASALKPDPFAAGSPVSDGDAWEKLVDAPAGSWAPAAPHRRPGHETLIGSEREWPEPPPVPAAETGYGFDAPFTRPILEKPPLEGGAAAIPSNWLDAPLGAEAVEPLVATGEAEARGATLEDPSSGRASVAAPDGDRLFEHFCAGAGLDPLAFAGEDRAALMERLGGIYRQAMLGVADLMQARMALRNEYRMAHTTVRPDGNNPFKWVPARRIAVEILREEGAGYTTGERALADALHDVKAHLLCMLAGMRAALGATFDVLSPQAVEARLAGRSYLIKAQREAALWATFVEEAERLRGEADDSADGPINRAFRQAYEAQADALGDGRQRR